MARIEKIGSLSIRNKNAHDARILDKPNVLDGESEPIKQNSCNNYTPCVPNCGEPEKSHQEADIEHEAAHYKQCIPLSNILQKVVVEVGCLYEEFVSNSKFRNS
jgi:hypothetical protein